MAARIVGADAGLVARARSPRALRRYALLVVALILLFVADGSRQPLSGPGWRILGYQRGVSGSADVIPIQDQQALDAAWDSLLLRSDAPALPAGATTFWVTSTGTFGCPSHFASLGPEPATTTVVLTFTLALTFGCDTINVPDSFLVAIDQDRLPAGPYHLERAGPHGVPDAVIAISP
jgi:hypothetical protein